MSTQKSAQQKKILIVRAYHEVRIVRLLLLRFFHKRSRVLWVRVVTLSFRKLIPIVERHGLRVSKCAE
jgi:hypothetical protein